MITEMVRMDMTGMNVEMDKGFKMHSNKWDFLWSSKLKDRFCIVKAIPIQNRKVNFNVNGKMNLNFQTDSRSKTFLKRNSAFLVETDINTWHERLTANATTVKRKFNQNLVNPQRYRKEMRTMPVQQKY